MVGGEFLLIPWIHFMTLFEVSGARIYTAHLQSVKYAQKSHS